MRKTRRSLYVLTTLGLHERADAVGGMVNALYILTFAYVALNESSLDLLDAFHDTELTKEIGSLLHSNNPIKASRNSG